jgi:hypothetical protein
LRRIRRSLGTGQPGVARTIVSLALALVLAACATTQKAEPLHGPLPALAPGQGRIVFYRPDNAFLGVLTPDVVVNGRSVGEAIVGSVFYRAAWPGDYTVFLAGHEDEAVTFALAPGDTRYVRISPHFSLTDSRLSLTLVDAATGTAQTQGLRHRGEAL